jgi:hypothetical protein
VELEAFDCGTKPSSPLQGIRRIQENRLLDPYSAHIDVLTVSRGAWREEDVLIDPLSLPEDARRIPFVLGWEVAYRIRAKNAFGAYTGPTYHLAFFRGEKIIADDSRSNDAINSMIQSAGHNIRVN